MGSNNFIGIDVGGIKKGFHCVCLNNRKIVSCIHDRELKNICKWIVDFNPDVIAVDAPCGWSANGLSRESERSLAINGKNISCFSTPTREKAKKSSFYKWIFNGEKLFNELSQNNFTVIETYPYGIAQCFAINVEKPKIELRKTVLDINCINYSSLNNIDEIDAALCSLTAKFYYDKKIVRFGNDLEGYIYLPKIN